MKGVTLNTKMLPPPILRLYPAQVPSTASQLTVS